MMMRGMMQLNIKSSTVGVYLRASIHGEILLYLRVKGINPGLRPVTIVR